MDGLQKLVCETNGQIILLVHYGRNRQGMLKFIAQRTAADNSAVVITKVSHQLWYDPRLNSDPKKANLIIFQDVDRYLAHCIPEEEEDNFDETNRGLFHLTRHLINPFRNRRGVILLFRGGDLSNPDLDFPALKWISRGLEMISDFSISLNELLQLVQPDAEKDEISSSISDLKINVENDIWHQVDHRVSFDSLYGMKEIKASLISMADEVFLTGTKQTSSVFKSVLLTGPPGTGKSCMVKALYNHYRNLLEKEKKVLTLISPTSADLLHSTFGTSERSIRGLFQRSKVSSPCILFFDEIEALFPSSGSPSSEPTYISFIQQLLIEFDKLNFFKANNEATADDGNEKERFQLLVIGATNYVERLNPGLMVKGRFECQLQFAFPNYSERRNYLLDRWGMQISGWSNEQLEDLIHEGDNRPILYLEHAVQQRIKAFKSKEENNVK